MPNWVFNGLTIEGSKESITKLKEQMNTPFTDEVAPYGDLSYGVEQRTFSNPIFAFRNIIAPTDLEAYKQQPWTGDSDNRVENPDSWYNWNIRNWGVKWDVAVSDDDKYSDTNIEEGENGENSVLHYNFNTAWGIPDEALINLSSQYPDLLFSLSYEEESGWGGEREYLRGEMISENEYNWRCNECDYEESDDSPWCDDCDYDMCPSCGYGEPDDEVCEVHKQARDKFLDKVLAERKLE